MKAKDMSGQKFGRLTVIERAPRPEFYSHKGVWWKCVCDCGRERTVAGHSLRAGGTRSCGCLRKDLPPHKGLDLTGQKFGHLIAVERVPRPDKVAQCWAHGRYYWWRCVCDCGGEKIVPSVNLTTSRTRSCGCRVKAAKERRKNARKTYFIDLFSAEHMC